MDLPTSAAPIRSSQTDLSSGNQSPCQKYPDSRGLQGFTGTYKQMTLVNPACNALPPRDRSSLPGNAPCLSNSLCQEERCTDIQPLSPLFKEGLQHDAADAHVHGILQQAPLALESPDFDSVFFHFHLRMNSSEEFVDASTGAEIVDYDDSTRTTAHQGIRERKRQHDHLVRALRLEKIFWTTAQQNRVFTLDDSGAWVDDEGIEWLPMKRRAKEYSIEVWLGHLSSPVYLNWDRSVRAFVGGFAEKESKGYRLSLTEVRLLMRNQSQSAKESMHKEPV